MIYDNYGYWHAKPTEQDFSLDVISKHPDFDGRTLKKYALDGINTVGVWGDEPFEVHFHNKSMEDAQVRISLDGTDVLTGKPANLEVNHDMWVVRAGKTLHLKAWAENSNGGARFVFTGADKSVALHAHGDMSHKGIISAAIFTERDRPRMITNSHPARRRNLHMKSAIPAASPMSYNTSPILGGAEPASTSCSVDGAYIDLDLKKEAAVGAGEYVSQKTMTVKGLDNPVLNSIVRVRYMWSDDIQSKLKASRYEDPHPTGFPGEKIRTFADLSGVPRVNSAASTRVGIYAEAQSSVANENRVFENQTHYDRFSV